jgi:hypothetical protein
MTVGARFSVPVQTDSGGPSNLLYNGYRVFPGGKERPGRDADPLPPSSSWSWKSRAIPLLSLWAVRPVQSLSACTRMQFTLTLLDTYKIHNLRVGLSKPRSISSNLLRLIIKNELLVLVLKFQITEIIRSYIQWLLFCFLWRL